MTSTLICRYKTLILLAATAILPLAIQAENRPPPNYNYKLTKRDLGVNDKINIDLNELTEWEYSTCVNDLLEATMAYDFMFEIPAYLKFIEYQSNGLLVKSKFDVQILDLVHIYWFVVCNVNSETCQDDSLVSVREIIQQQDGDGVRLIYKLCKRLDVYLERNGFQDNGEDGYPTMMPSLQPSRVQARFPSPSPQDKMTNHPSLEPAESLSQMPTYHQVLSDVPSVTGPTSRPSVVITSVPSKFFLQRPSVQPSIDNDQFQSGMPSSQPTAQRERSHVPSMLPSRVLSIHPSQVRNGPSPLIPTSTPSSDPSIRYLNAPSTIIDTHTPSSSPTTRVVTVDMSYEIEYSTSCLRFVFYDQVLINVKDALGCLVMGDCPYAISILLVLKDRGEIYEAGFVILIVLSL